MSKRIEKLSEAQAAKLSAYREKWLARGLAVGPCDRKAMERAADEAYKAAGKKPPRLKIWLGSPFAGAIGAAFLTSAQVWDQVRAQVRDQVGDQVRDQVWAQVAAQVKDATANFYHGSLWANWGAYISYFRDVCGWNAPILERFKIDEDLVTSCGWVWWHQNVLAISDRPASISRDDRHRLHSETGPSIVYRDGWSLWHWHGTTIPSEWITNRESLDAKIALGQTNLEQRRAACEILGWARILNELGGKTINKDKDPEIGELIEVNLPHSGPERFLRVQCGTKRSFVIPVPRTIKTALAANSWTYDIPVNLMKQKESRT